jgi:hypothetical protein
MRLCSESQLRFCGDAANFTVKFFLHKVEGRRLSLSMLLLFFDSVLFSQLSYCQNIVGFIIA